jgi:hypothetical protein
MKSGNHKPKWTFRLTCEDREFMRMLAAERNCTATDVLRTWIAAERRKIESRNEQTRPGSTSPDQRRIPA